MSVASSMLVLGHLYRILGRAVLRTARLWFVAYCPCLRVPGRRRFKRTGGESHVRLDDERRSRRLLPHGRGAGGLLEASACGVLAQRNNGRGCTHPFTRKL